MTANPDELIIKIKAHIAKGDKATEKADQHYISAGQYLAKLKGEHAGSWAEWEALLKAKIGISTGRASELMQIADGRKTAEGVRAGKAESMKRLRASSPRGEENKSAPPPIQREPEAEHSPSLPTAHTEEPETAPEPDGLAEKLRAAEFKIAGLKSEVEDLKTERAQLRARVTELEIALGASGQTEKPKRGRGRPKGSKNKPKPAAEIVADAGNEVGEAA